VALKGILNEDWSATLTYSFQRQHTIGAWDEDPNLAPRTVERFGPESRLFEAKTLDFHLEGYVGIGDLVFASTYWALPTRQQNEYSQYIENYAGGANEGFTCVNDPVYGTGPYTGCKVPIQYYEYHTSPQRWSNELRLASKPGGRFHWLGGLYWERTEDKFSGSTYFMPGLRTDSPHVSILQLLQRHGAGIDLAASRPDLCLHGAIGLPADHRVRQHQLRRHRQAQRRSRRRALSFPFQLRHAVRSVSPTPQRRLRSTWAPRTSGTASSASTTRSRTR